jgi:hypothetical protein
MIHQKPLKVIIGHGYQPHNVITFQRPNYKRLLRKQNTAYYFHSVYVITSGMAQCNHIKRRSL